MGFFRRRSPLKPTTDALMVEFGPTWFSALPQRLLESVWDGDYPLVISDGRRLAKVLSQSTPPVGAVHLQVCFLQALFMSAAQWTQVSHRQDPSNDIARCAEVPVVVRELVEATMRQAALRAGGKGEVLADWWMRSAADLVVRSVRFRDGFSMPLLGRELSKYPHVSRTADQLLALEAPTRPMSVARTKTSNEFFSPPRATTGMKISVHSASGVRGIATTQQARLAVASAAGSPASSGQPQQAPGRHAVPPQVAQGLDCALDLPPAAPQTMPEHTAGSYLLHLCQVSSRIVNGVTVGARNAQECMQLIERRFGGQYPFATAMRAAMVAIRDGDQETLRELADLTAAAGNEDSPARVLHSLVLAGEKVLYGRVA